MRTRTLLFGVAIVTVMVAIGIDLVLAQDAQQQGRRQRGRFDPQAMRQRMLDRIKETLKVADEDWTVLKPMVEKVQTLSREVGTGGGRRAGFGRRGRRDRQRPAEDAAPQSDVAKAFQEVQKVLENEGATPGEIKAKLKALREAREKSKQELAKARTALRTLLTVRQEAQMVVMGLLD